MSKTIQAWRVSDSNTVTEVTLTLVSEAGPNSDITWWRTPRGAQVAIDYQHSDYFSDEGVAYEKALGRATYLRTQAEESLRLRLHREHEAHIALSEYRKRQAAK